MTFGSYLFVPSLHFLTPFLKAWLVGTSLASSQSPMAINPFANTVAVGTRKSKSLGVSHRARLDAYLEATAHFVRVAREQGPSVVSAYEAAQAARVALGPLEVADA